MNGTRLYRSPTDRVLAGVAGGMAETYNWDPAIVRVMWALLILLTGGTLLILYIVMALVIPLRPEPLPPGYTPAGYGPPGYGPASGFAAPGGFAPVDPNAPADTNAPVDPNAPTALNQPSDAWSGWRQGHGERRADMSGGLIIGVILILIGVFFLAREFFPVLELNRFWPVLVIGMGLVLLLGAFARRGR